MVLAVRDILRTHRSTSWVHRGRERKTLEMAREKGVPKSVVGVMSGSRRRGASLHLSHGRSIAGIGAPHGSVPGTPGAHHIETTPFVMI